LLAMAKATWFAQKNQKVAMLKTDVMSSKFHTKI
jgi:hypothetical protein